MFIFDETCIKLGKMNMISFVSDSTLEFESYPEISKPYLLPFLRYEMVHF